MSTEDQERTEVLESLVLGPEDRLVVVLRDGTTKGQMDAFTRGLTDKGWDGRVLVIVGAEELAVLRAPTAPGSTVGPCGEVNTVRPIGGGMIDYRCHLAANHPGDHVADQDGATCQWPERSTVALLPAPTP